MGGGGRRISFLGALPIETLNAESAVKNARSIFHPSLKGENWPLAYFILGRERGRKRPQCISKMLSLDLAVLKT